MFINYLSDLIKTRTGVDVYQLSDDILDKLKIENIKIHPGRMHLRNEEDTLNAFDKVGSKLDDMTSPKELDDILDKISKYGMSSLTSQEKADLEKLSK